MKPFRPLAVILATLFLVATSAFGDGKPQSTEPVRAQSTDRTRPRPTDVQAILTQYFQIMGSDNGEEALKNWMATQSEAELASIPVVIGYGLLNQIGANPLTDRKHYDAYNSAIGLMEKGVVGIEKSGSHDGLYLKTGVGMIPAKAPTAHFSLTSGVRVLPLSNPILLTAYRTYGGRFLHSYA